MAILLRAYDYRTQQWITGKDALPIMLTRSRNFLRTITENADEYCRATKYPRRRIPRLIATVQREIAILEKLT